MPRPSGQELIDQGRGTQWPAGKSGNPKGRPVLDPVERLIREQKLEAALAAQWVADLRDENPAIRLPTRRDLMDRVNGKAHQAMSVTFDARDDEEVESVPPW